MVTIKRDYSDGRRGDLFKITLSEPLHGVQPKHWKRATLHEAQIALAHYYEPGDASHIREQCPICHTITTQQEKRRAGTTS